MHSITAASTGVGLFQCVQPHAGQRSSTFYPPPSTTANGHSRTGPAVPKGMAKKTGAVAATVGPIAAFAMVEEAMVHEAVVEGGPAVDPFADTDRDWTQGEVIEVLEPSTQSWFDELESVTA